MPGWSGVGDTGGCHNDGEDRSARFVEKPVFFWSPVSTLHPAVRTACREGKGEDDKILSSKY